MRNTFSPTSMPIYFYSKNEEYGSFSNFAPYGFYEDGKRWKTIEHYFQAKKFADPGYSEKIRICSTPKEARELGQSRRFPIRNNWDEERLSVMRHAVKMKFSSNQDLSDMLIETGDEELIENSPYDYFWGIGKTGEGRNWLGKILMEFRNELKSKLNQTG